MFSPIRKVNLSLVFNSFSSKQLVRNNIIFRLHSTSTADTSVPTTSSKGPLDGIRILDLSRVLAGPFCSMLLGDLGAEVIKIEHPERGDDTRSWGPPFAPYTIESKYVPNKLNKLKTTTFPGESAYFLCANRNKKSVAINIKEPKGQDIVKQLAKKCDILIENYVPGKLEEFGLGYNQIKDVNDKLIYASITGYGHTGPFSKNPGYDVMIEAEAGLMHITGESTSNPVKVGVAITDVVTGLYAHGAIMAALISRSKTNVGQHLDINLLGSQLSALVNIGSNYLIGNTEASRWGSEHPSIVPYRNYQTKTDPICIGGGNDSQFKSLVKSLDLTEILSSADEFSSNSLRVKNRAKVDSIIQTKLNTMTRDEVIKALENKGVPHAPINNMQQTFEHPQVLARNLVANINHKYVGNIKIVQPAVTYSNSPATIRLPPPMLGQHTESVLKDILNYSKESVNNLCSEGVISTFE
ncbi:Succinate-hydroxymethylglutarate CoA-transferase [Smittium culicis]|uniref:Succinate-hydroxymethylglutarate CoA-transferase n=1 Tax=Smittium culicis TaxID=133412 RepID=A0A1R1YQQ9_9FUNG|nr:Succinate-hydroxymethylglutarate CoA-transferase [Smittium culicis]OMJ29231.1 Succinate-hydroxymethylglutarate CoA-transferase [Smittium culicis]